MGQDSVTEWPSGHAVYKRRFFVLRVLRNHYIENRDQPLFLNTITKMLEGTQYLNKTLRNSDIKPILEDMVKKGLVEVKNPGSWESYVLTPNGLEWWNRHGKETASVIFNLD